jgi:hypothetical protein
MRQAEVTRQTAQTHIRVAINLDGTSQAKLASGISFLDHMLDQIARHGLMTGAGRPGLFHSSGARLGSAHLQCRRGSPRDRAHWPAVGRFRCQNRAKPALRNRAGWPQAISPCKSVFFVLRL